MSSGWAPPRPPWWLPPATATKRHPHLLSSMFLTFPLALSTGTKGHCRCTLLFFFSICFYLPFISFAFCLDTNDDLLGKWRRSHTDVLTDGAGYMYFLVWFWDMRFHFFTTSSSYIVFFYLSRHCLYWYINLHRNMTPLFGSPRLSARLCITGETSSSTRTCTYAGRTASGTRLGW